MKRWTLAFTLLVAVIAAPDLLRAQGADADQGVVDAPVEHTTPAPQSTASVVADAVDDATDNMVGNLKTAAEKVETVAEPVLRGLLPERWAGKTVIGIETWQWLGLLVTVFIGFLLDFCVRAVFRFLITHHTRKRSVETQSQTTARTVRPIGLLVSGGLWVMVLSTNLLALPDRVQVILLGAAQVFIALMGTLAAWRLTDLISDIATQFAQRTATKVDDVLIPMARKTLKIFIVIIGVIYVAQSLNIPIGPLVASLGIGSLAFAFAAKDTIENFFGSVAVLVDRPFSVGDFISVDDVSGIVEEIGFRSTRVRSLYNSLVTVPNANLVRANVDNYGKRKYRRWQTNIGVQYDTTPDQMVAFCEGIRELVRSHPYTRKDYYQAYVNEFAGSSINILLNVFFETDDWTIELRERERLFLDIVRLADRLGVEFAFPTQTVHLYQEQPVEPGRRGKSHDIPQRTTEEHAAKHGFELARELIKDQPWREHKPGPVEYQPGEQTQSDDDAPTESGQGKSAIEDKKAG
ncbi:MAG: mechanosensitive ion channel [Phycisphaera sp.]|nr:mechanosensitive ion channel [Phycisphaera sp.]